MHLSNHFTLDELTHSDTASREGIPNQPGGAEVEALRALCEHVLEPLRVALNRSIKINSGYRGPALNQRLRGATKSQHLSGEAADIQCPGIPVVEVFKTAIRLGLPFDQIIYEANRSARWVHVSCRPGANRGEIRVAKFGPDGRPLSYPHVSVQEAMALTESVTRSSRGGTPGYIEGADEPEHADLAHAAPASQAVARTPAPKKSVAKKAPPKKTVVKKPVVKKAAPKKVPAKKAPAKKAAVRKTAPKKAAPKKAAPKKAAPKKAAAKKAPPKKTVVRQAVAKKAVAKKTPAKKAPARKARPSARTA